MAELERKLITLRQRAIQNVMERTSEAAEKSMARIQPFNDLSIAAYMDINKTTDSLQHILEYKKELANVFLTCYDQEKLDTYAEGLIHADNLIKKVLGILTTPK